MKAIYGSADPGLRNARLGFRQLEETHLMENDNRIFFGFHSEKGNCGLLTENCLGSEAV